jgi:hypothetical protein
MKGRVDPFGKINGYRRQLASTLLEQGMWLEYIDPQEAEGEHFEVYEKILGKLEKIPLGRS